LVPVGLGQDEGLLDCSAKVLGSGSAVAKVGLG
jgi:hypothetical protein